MLDGETKRFPSIPAYTKNTDGSVGMLKRQCTSDYKIQQVDRAIRDFLGVKRVQNQKVNIWKGISLEEIERMSIPDNLWKTHIYSFCGYSVSKIETIRLKTTLMTRNDIINWYIENDLPIPPKSACVFCPYHSDISWLDMKLNAPSDFKAAVRVDRAIRDSTKKGIRNPLFLHKDCVPLENVKFNNRLPDLWSGDCAGICHN